MRALLIAITLCFCQQLFATSVQVMQNGPIHEAFVTKEGSHLLQRAVPLKPPEPIREKIPEREIGDAQWIEGYWAFSEEHDDFMWISGVWRRPPPHHEWMGGKWVRSAEGWVWQQGLWFHSGSKELNYVTQPPPDLIDESVTAPSSEDFFWVPGYWDFDKDHFVWYEGRWEEFHREWIYTPAHYCWHEGKYLLVKGYWDYSLLDRGELFPTVLIPPEERSTYVLAHEKSLDPFYPIHHLFPSWPSYAVLFNHHFHFHRDLWASWKVAPPWWKWQEWWTFTEVDQWGLFWWWTHSDYPAPFFMTKSLAKELPPPSKRVLKLMQYLEPPLFVTREGVAPVSQIIKAIREYTGYGAPVLPASIDRVHDIQSMVVPPSNLEARSYRPVGTRTSHTPLQKPTLGVNKGQFTHPPRKVAIPKVPEVEVTREERPQSVKVTRKIETVAPPPFKEASPKASKEKSESRSRAFFRKRRHPVLSNTKKSYRAPSKKRGVPRSNTRGESFKSRREGYVTPPLEQSSPLKNLGNDQQSEPLQQWPSLDNTQQAIQGTMPPDRTQQQPADQ